MASAIRRHITCRTEGSGRPVTDDPSPTLRRLELGTHLRRLRKERGWTTQELAARLGFSASKVSRMETGARGVNAKDLASITKLFELDEEWAEHLDAIARTGKKRMENRSAIVFDTDFIQIRDPSFVDLERDADRIREYNSLLVPGLLQTESYMRAAMAGGLPDVDAEQIDASVAVRLERQRILSRPDPPRFDVVIDEAALHRRVGGVVVMREQLGAILDALSLGVVTLGVIPFDTGAHPGVNSDFLAFHADGPAKADVIFVEGLAGQLRFDKPQDVARYDRIWAMLRGFAASPDESRRLLERVMGDLSSRVADR
jgi:transcriptional regulator with XRE-family HTH domain